MSTNIQIWPPGYVISGSQTWRALPASESPAPAVSGTWTEMQCAGWMDGDKEEQGEWAGTESSREGSCWNAVVRVTCACLTIQCCGRCTSRSCLHSPFRLTICCIAYGTWRQCAMAKRCLGESLCVPTWPSTPPSVRWSHLFPCDKSVVKTVF